MLKIHKSLRRYLCSKGALTIDGRGDEVLVGMDHAETIFYLQFEQPESTTDADGEACLYRDLQDRHLRARVAQLIDPVPRIDRRKAMR